MVSAFVRLKKGVLQYHTNVLFSISAANVEMLAYLNSLHLNSKNQDKKYL